MDLQAIKRAIETLPEDLANREVLSEIAKDADAMLLVMQMFTTREKRQQKMLSQYNQRLSKAVPIIGQILKSEDEEFKKERLTFLQKDAAEFYLIFKGTRPLMANTQTCRELFDENEMKNIEEERRFIINEI